MKPRSVLFGFITALIMSLQVLSSAALADNVEQQKAKTAYTGLLKNDPAFAASESAFAAAKRGFLSRFAENTKPMALALLKLDTAWDIPQQLEDHFTGRLLHGTPAISHHTGQDYVRERAGIMRYMKLVTDIQKRDKAWLILMRPVCMTVGAGYDTIDGWTARPAWRQIEATLAEYDAHIRGSPLALPDIHPGDRGRNHQLQHFPGLFTPQYHLRKIDGHYWGAILMSGQELQYSGSVHRQIALAFVLPYSGSQTEIQPVFSPLLEDFYPSSQGRFYDESRRKAFMPEGSDGYYGIKDGPKGEQIRMGALQGIIQISNKSGPFEFLVTAKDLKMTMIDAGRDTNEKVYHTDLAYHVVPECSFFPFNWNHTEKKVTRSDPVCREKGQWGAYVPFEGHALIPVKEAYAAFMKNDRLKDHERKLARTAASFFSLFGSEERRVVESQYTEWLYDRQFALLNFVDDKDKFIDYVITSDTPVMKYMQAVISFSKKPDARLIYLLEPLHAHYMQIRFSEPPVENDRDKEEAEKRYRNSLTSTREYHRPRYTRLLHAQMQPLKAPKEAEKAPSSMMFTRSSHTGFSGGNRIKRTYSRLFGSRISFRKEPTNTEIYEIHRADNGDFWGLATLDAFYSYGPNKAIDRHTRHITYLTKGQIQFITPVVPHESRFFRSGKISWPGMETVKEQLKKKDRRKNPFFGEETDGMTCPMLPSLDVRTDIIPFHITAIDRQIPFETGLLYVCTPECAIPYSWNGTHYISGEPVCQPEGEWGVTFNDATSALK